MVNETDDLWHAWNYWWREMLLTFVREWVNPIEDIGEKVQENDFLVVKLPFFKWRCLQGNLGHISKKQYPISCLATFIWCWCLFIRFNSKKHFIFPSCSTIFFHNWNPIISLTWESSWAWGTWKSKLESNINVLSFVNVNMKNLDGKT